jgi:hypothetical protein
MPSKNETENMVFIENQICLDVNCPVEAEEKLETSSSSNSMAMQTNSPSNSSLNSSTNNSNNNNNKTKKCLDDDEETFEIVFNNLPNNLSILKECIHKAQGCCLLLILKFFLKEVYSISERLDKIQ